MATPEPDTVFCKHVVSLMARHGYVASNTVVNYCEDIDDADVMSPRAWDMVVADFGSAVKGLLLVSPEQAINLVTSVTDLITEDTTDAYWSLLLHLKRQHVLFNVWAQAKDTDQLYAFSTMFMLFSEHINSRDELSELVSVIIGRPFRLGDVPGEWSEEFAQEMFGPVWVALNVEYCMSDGEYIEAILEAQPPIVGRTVKSTALVDLPVSLG